MSALVLEDFDPYFRAVHGHAPFPWQARLLRQVVEQGWPALLDLPTASGKTATLDIALFHMALEATLPPHARRAPRRVFMVVDRRLIVDQAHERARSIAHKLAGEPDNPVLASMAQALRRLSASEIPVATAILRGGLPRDRTWARTPDQPLLGVSTVDQVGSRLLFRGYGVSASSRPIEAALLGNDALILLDEVHLAYPFAEALGALGRYRAHEHDQAPLCPRWQVVALSATPATPGSSVFRLDDDDRAEPELARRLNTRKPARLVAVATKGEEAARRATFVQACVDGALTFQRAGRRAVAIVVNRVDTARRVFEALTAARADAAAMADPLDLDALQSSTEVADGQAPSRPECVLLTGRMRPFDRDLANKLIESRVRAGHERASDRPLFVVATQCIEAGADFDFDALVTECASLDALRQRFGRLDRLGHVGDASAVVLARADQVKADADDAVYGPALAETWRWLHEQPQPVDFGIAHLKLPPAGQSATTAGAAAGISLDRLMPPLRHAPIMLPAHLDAWVQTSPAPAVDPDVGLWLHGLDVEGLDEVQIVWRADLTEATLDLASSTDSGLEELSERLEACPPRPPESLSVPIAAARRWLLGQDEAPLADVTLPEHEERSRREQQRSRTAARWQGGATKVVTAYQLHPGDTLVVPATYGGLQAHSRTWDPTAHRPVRDLGDLVQARDTLRLDANYLAQWGLANVPTRDENAPLAEWRQALRPWLDELTPPPSFAKIVRALQSQPGFRIIGELALVARRVKAADDVDITTEPDISSFTEATRDITLADHSAGVRDQARAFAERCGLPEPLAQDIALAAWLHDIGKADPRFQTWLRNDPVPTARLLAKSRLGTRERAAREAARRRAGYPAGGRHELLSVALATGTPLMAGAHDADLVLHLVASHHGFARPFAPHAADATPEAVRLEWDGHVIEAPSVHALERLDSPVPERFWRLVRRYGWYGLAWMEAVLRLADHRRSEAEVLGQPGPREQA